MHKFVKLGLVEEVLKFSLNSMHVDVCMNILANTVFENVEYAEMMLENNVQRHAFGLFGELFREGRQWGRRIRIVDFPSCGCWLHCWMPEDTMEYKQQFLEILNFAMEVLKT